MQELRNWLNGPQVQQARLLRGLCCYVLLALVAFLVIATATRTIAPWISATLIITLLGAGLRVYLLLSRRAEPGWYAARMKKKALAAQRKQEVRLQRQVDRVRRETRICEAKALATQRKQEARARKMLERELRKMKKDERAQLRTEEDKHRARMSHHGQQCKRFVALIMIKALDTLDSGKISLARHQAGIRSAMAHGRNLDRRIKRIQRSKYISEEDKSTLIKELLDDDV